MRHMIRNAIAALFFPAALVAQGAMPKVGDMAPDFTLASGTRDGISAKPLTLSSLRGQVVVIAFYPRQRSSGCTTQMRHYRDAYDQIFNGGKGVKLLAVSTDSVKDIASWAKDSSFQFTMVSDVDAVAGKAYGTMYPGTRNMEKRVLFVVAPTGKIAYVMNPFNEIDPTAYTELTKAINDAKGMK
jgi:thioredoxin-dependent peroxiredoxin